MKASDNRFSAMRQVGRRTADERPPAIKFRASRMTTTNPRHQIKSILGLYGQRAKFSADCAAPLDTRADLGSVGFVELRHLEEDVHVVGPSGIFVRRIAGG